MESENNLIRVNIRVSKKIKEYFEKKSAETGVAQSALMALALDEYIDQKQVVDFTTNGGIQDLLRQIEEKKNEIN